MPTESGGGLSVRYCCSVCRETHTLPKPTSLTYEEALDLWLLGGLLRGGWRVYAITMANSCNDNIQHEVTLIPA